MSAFAITLLSMSTNWLPQQLQPMLPLLSQPEQRGIPGGSGSMAGQPPTKATFWDGLPAQLWALHTTLCRLIASLSAGQLSLWGERMTAVHWRLLLLSVNAVLLAAISYLQRKLSIHADNIMEFLLTAPRCALQMQPANLCTPGIRITAAAWASRF